MAYHFPWQPSWCVALIIAVIAPAHSQSLEQAVVTTLATDPELRGAFHQLQSFRERTKASEGDYLPDVDLNAGMGYERIDNDTTQAQDDLDFARKDATLNVRQLLWDGQTHNNIARNQYEAESQRFQLRSDASDKALRVAEVYLEILKAQQVLDLSRANMTVHEEILADIRRRADTGIGSTADLSQVQARVARAQANLLSAETNLEDAFTAFFRVVGVPANNTVQPVIDKTRLPTSLDSALEQAVKRNPLLKLARYDIEAAKSQYQQFKGAHHPNISVEVSQTWADEVSGVDDFSDEFSAMLRVRYQLFNGGSDQADIRRGSYELNRAKDIFDNAYRQLEESTRLAWSAFQLTEQQKALLQQQVDAASDTVQAYEKQFRIGRRTLLDLLNTENELLEARRAYLDANYDHLLAQYRLLNNTGHLLEALRVSLPKQWQGTEGETE
ncbi:TolC family outer membrane protein [Salinivibrio kushneri]|uniref:TolC family outer membrane protein n=1 Tax=Salinivibrio kushneri TaxID=1908198 RepID=UPI0009871CE4|nr:TolC family outer membrane protein [Salinivibrio kushneri]OOE48885.1 agglutination protein [Salinivibrio kushneri]OOE49435.1 agglutination protein [Salinivibrio kushneri]OOE62824.1 agglutination protein [Salinivibrio kushneri]